MWDLKPLGRRCLIFRIEIVHVDRVEVDRGRGQLRLQDFDSPSPDKVPAREAVPGRFETCRLRVDLQIRIGSVADHVRPEGDQPLIKSVRTLPGVGFQGDAHIFVHTTPLRSDRNISLVSQIRLTAVSRVRSYGVIADWRSAWSGKRSGGPMADEASIPDLLVLASAGTALVLVGAVHLVGYGWSWRYKVGSTAAIVLGASLLPLAIGDLRLTAAAAGLTIFVGAVLVLATSGRIATVLQAMHGLIRRPAIRSALVVVAGAVLIVGAYVKFTYEEQAVIDGDSAFAEMM